MKKRGFTLVELMTTIAILGIIILIAIPVINIQLKNSRQAAFKVTCDKIYSLDETFEMYQELIGDDADCVTFDFDRNIETREEIDGEIYEPISSLGLDDTSNIKGQYKICKNKELIINNGEFRCFINKNNDLIFDINDPYDVPLLVGASLKPSRKSIEVNVKVEGQADNYYYKLDDGKFIKTNTSNYTFTGLKPKTKYKITIYVDNKYGIKSDEKVYYATTEETCMGVEDDAKAIGDTVVYGDTEWIVVKDNGDTLTLISKYNISTGKYGDTSSWNDSEVKKYLNDVWAKENKYINYDIEKDGIVYDEQSKSYVRLIRIDEVSTKLANASKTPFWTMSEKDGKVYYALKNGKTEYDKYDNGESTPVIYYSGSSTSLDAIKHQCLDGTIKTVKATTLSTPSSTNLVTTSNAQQELTTGKKSYKTYETQGAVIGQRCTTATVYSDTQHKNSGYTLYKPTTCDSVTVIKTNGGKTCTVSKKLAYCTICEKSVFTSTTSTQTVTLWTTPCSKSKCTTSKCTKSKTESACTAHRRTSCGEDKKAYNCGQTACGKERKTSTSCNKYYVSSEKKYETECGPKEYIETKYCDKTCTSTDTRYCDAECTAWSTSYPCAANGYKCVGYSCTKYSERTSTGVTYKYKTAKISMQYCPVVEDTEPIYDKLTMYEADGSAVTCKGYVISETTDIAGIRAVITVKKRGKGC